MEALLSKYVLGECSPEETVKVEAAVVNRPE